MKDERVLTVSGLFTYPVKSCKGISLEKMKLNLKGPELDRRWMVVDKEGRFVSQRAHPKMALIGVEVMPDKLLFRTQSLPPLIVPRKTDGEKRAVVIWKDTVEAIDQGSRAAEWFSEFFEMEARLVYLPDETVRQVDQRYAPRIEDQVGFADAYPILLISEASLSDLNWRLKSPVPMNRFRPNIVVSGCDPFEEDRWKKILIGDVRFDAVKPCSRCVTINVDQITGKKEEEPMKTLLTYRKVEDKVLFGQNVIHSNLGTIGVGMEVKILNS